MNNTVALGFDYGIRRIGVAVGQTVTATATALTTLSARDGVPNWTEIEQLIAHWQPDTLVVGLPLRGNGESSDTTEAARRFARRLEGRYNLPVQMLDEHLSSHEAETRLAGKGKRFQKRDIDALAAQVILENWLELNG